MNRDILAIVISFLDTRGFLNARAVCRDWKSIADKQFTTRAEKIKFVLTHESEEWIKRMTARGLITATAAIIAADIGPLIDNTGISDIKLATMCESCAFRNSNLCLLHRHTSEYVMKGVVQCPSCSRHVCINKTNNAQSCLACMVIFNASGVILTHLNF